MVTVTNKSTFTTRQRAILLECRLQCVTNIFTEIELEIHFFQQRTLPFPQSRLDLWKHGQGAANELQIPGTGASCRGSCQKTFHIVDIPQRFLKIINKI